MIESIQNRPLFLLLLDNTKSKHEYIPYVLNDGNIHCQNCKHTISVAEWWEQYFDKHERIRLENTK
jgi:hypothetical protein